MARSSYVAFQGDHFKKVSSPMIMPCRKVGEDDIVEINQRLIELYSV